MTSAIEVWTVDTAVERITAAYGKSVAAVIETGRELIEAKSRVPHGQWLKVVERLPFSDSTARRLMEIAGSAAIANRAHGHDLPSSWRTLAVLSQLPQSEIDQGIRNGTIHPDMERKNAEWLVEVWKASIVPDPLPDPDEIVDGEIVDGDPEPIGDAVDKRIMDLKKQEWRNAWRAKLEDEAPDLLAEHPGDIEAAIRRFEERRRLADDLRKTEEQEARQHTRDYSTMIRRLGWLTLNDTARKFWVKEWRPSIVFDEDLITPERIDLAIEGLLDLKKAVEEGR